MLKKLKVGEIAPIRKGCLTGGVSMRMLLAGLLLLVSTGAEAFSLNWKVTIQNLKTKEEKYYVPGDEDFSLSMPGQVFQCTLTKQDMDNSDGFNNVLRFLRCDSGSSIFGISTTCSRSLDGNPRSVHNASELLIVGVPGPKGFRYSVGVTCTYQ